MDKLKTILIVIISLLLFSPSIAWGASVDPSDVGVGARPMGMGKAFVGLADDGSAIFINPAGLATFDNLKLTSMQTTILGDINYIVLGGARPYDFGTLGVGLIRVDTGAIPLTTLVDGRPSQTGATNYSANVLFFSYGTHAQRFLNFDFLRDVSLGSSLKIFREGFSNIVNGNGMGFDMDVGALYRPREHKWLSFGLNQQNVLPASLGGKVHWETGNDEGVPTVTKFGLAAKVIGPEGCPYQYGEQRLLAGLDFDMFPTRNRPMVYHLGFEWWPMEILALRLGRDQKPASGGAANNMTLGLGIHQGGFGFDYTYYMNENVSENSVHYFSLSYVGEKAEVEEEEEIIEEEVLEEVEELELKTFIDVYEGYWAQKPIEYLATLGIVGGYPDGTFKPEKPLTRGELAVSLIKAKGIEPKPISRAAFADLPATNWLAKYVKAAVDQGFVGGYADGTFKPEKKVSRAEGIVILVRFAGLKLPKTVTGRPFPDVSPKHWAAKSIVVARRAGLLKYLEGKNFELKRGMTRAEAVEVLSRTEFGKRKIEGLLQ